MPKADTGIVVGTYGGVPYVHLQLEQWCRLHPGTGMLVHDDSSPQRQGLAELCACYGAGFASTTQRLGQQRGDVSAFRAGLHWSSAEGHRVLIKQSMRWVPRRPHADRLAAALDGHHVIAGVMEPSHATARPKTPCMHTDLFAVLVPAWDKPQLYDKLDHFVAHGGTWVECSMTDWLPVAAQGAGMQPRVSDVSDVLNPGRWTRHPGYLWHNWARPQEYAELAASLGLPYTTKDFEGYPD